MSLVRSRRDSIELGFLTDLRRMNVSVTRARRQFFLVANSDTMRESSELNKLLSTMSEHGVVVKLANENRAKVRKLLVKNK
jgi:superfamily I DNA and/or RNA helicase